MKMGNLRTWMSLAAIALLIELVVAANISVGGPNSGWDTTTDLQSWGSSQTFAVGDNLIFQYTALHDVLEVTKADYDGCQATSPQKTYSGGNTIITLASPGKRYFICGTPGHCSSGMKLEVNVVAPAATPPTSPPSSPSPSPPTSPPSSPSPSPPTSPPSLPPPSSQPPSPKIPPSVAPAPPKKVSPAPGSSPTVPSSSSPSLAPSDTTPATPSPTSPTGVTPRPSPSAANGNNSLLKLAVGFGSGLVLLLAI